MTITPSNNVIYFIITSESEEKKIFADFESFSNARSEASGNFKLVFSGIETEAANGDINKVYFN